MSKTHKLQTKKGKRRQPLAEGQASLTEVDSRLLSLTEYIRKRPKHRPEFVAVVRQVLCMGAISLKSVNTENSSRDIPRTDKIRLQFRTESGAQSAIEP